MENNGHRLVLFDIDGTLLSAGRVSRDALAEALDQVHAPGVALDGYDFSGKTDPQIVRELLEPSLGSAGALRVVAQALDLYLENLERRMSQASVVVKPGAAELLSHLARNPKVTLALLTGNMERGARIKLSPAGFNEYFSFGAFGSDNADRYLLPAVAVERARGAAGREFRAKEVVIVGDSVHDVACGRSLNVRSVAVATGLTSAETLRREEPDAFLDDFRDLRKAVEAILS